ncbi:MAG TPA: hypothetical protein VGR14_06670, partial [Verrucomicrobiae bacterium]|nr:hypothetical protein [Verrucomicrobiae bacterium]
NGPTVPDTTNYNASMPAIYAQAYQGGNGKRYVVLTNKGSNNAPVQILQDGVALTNSFLETFVSGSDPSATNSAPDASPVFIQMQTVTNPVTIPQYSVVRLEWTVFNVPPPSLALTSSRPARTLSWIGLTNVTYTVQSATNLAGTWATLGKVSSTQTNFSFTDLDTESLRYYRLVVP